MKKFIVVFIISLSLIATFEYPCAGIIYEAKSKNILRIILPDYNIELYEQPLQSNERILIIPILSWGDTYACGKYINIFACKRLVELI